MKRRVVGLMSFTWGSIHESLGRTLALLRWFHPAYSLGGDACANGAESIKHFKIKMTEKRLKYKWKGGEEVIKTIKCFKDDYLSFYYFLATLFQGQFLLFGHVFKRRVGAYSRHGFLILA